MKILMYADAILMKFHYFPLTLKHRNRCSSRVYEHWKYSDWSILRFLGKESESAAECRFRFFAGKTTIVSSIIIRCNRGLFYLSGDVEIAISDGCRKWETTAFRSLISSSYKFIKLLQITVVFKFVFLCQHDRCTATPSRVTVHTGKSSLKTSV